VRLLVILIGEIVLQALSFPSRIIIFGLTEAVLANLVALGVLVGGDGEGFESALLILLT